MEKFLVIITLLCIITICHTYALIHNRIPRHHKFRHKHNIFYNHRVNEIREAFDDYKNTIEKPKSTKVSFNDAIKMKSLRHHQKNDHKINDDLTKSASEYQFVNDERSKSEMTRYKRVHTEDTTTVEKKTEKFSENNYDEEYDDEEEGRKNSKFSDNSVSKVQETETAGETLTSHKLASLSTRTDVKKSFDNHRIKQQEVIDNYDRATITKKIRENMLRTKIEGMCRWPNKKVVETPQSASKIYSPRKYVIHQCSDDTACCGSNEKTCVAKKSEEIVLWFHVRNAVGSSSMYESLKVENHTECECLYRNRLTSLRSSEHRYPQFQTTTSTTRRPNETTCKCPIYFEVEQEDDNCGCYCRNGKPGCRQRYEGKEGFTISDQRCIQESQCIQPHCLYGMYSVLSGRCPNRNEKIRRGFQKATQ